MTSGQMWNHIRGPPYAHKNPQNGQVVRLTPVFLGFIVYCFIVSICLSSLLIPSFFYRSFFFFVAVFFILPLRRFHFPSCFWPFPCFAVCSVTLKGSKCFFGLWETLVRPGLNWTSCSLEKKKTKTSQKWLSNSEEEKKTKPDKDLILTVRFWPSGPSPPDP